MMVVTIVSELMKQATESPEAKKLTLADDKVDELASELLFSMRPVRDEHDRPWTLEIVAADIRAGKFGMCGIPVKVVK